jgi:hypothetical protein
MNKKSTHPPEQEFSFSVSNADKRIPKYCNGIILNKLDNGNIILTLVAKEKIKKATGEIFDDNVIIERVIIDNNHAKKIAEKINELTD